MSFATDRHPVCGRLQAIDRFDASRREQFSKSDKDKRAETKKQRELERQARARERAEREVCVLSVDLFVLLRVFRIAHTHESGGHVM